MLRKILIILGVVFALKLLCGCEKDDTDHTFYGRRSQTYMREGIDREPLHSVPCYEFDWPTTRIHPKRQDTLITCRVLACVKTDGLGLTTLWCEIIDPPYENDTGFKQSNGQRIPNS